MIKELMYSPKYRASVARWRIENPLEHFLADLADDSDTLKCVYVLFYKIFDRKYYIKGKSIVDKIYKNRKEELCKFFGKGGVKQSKIITDMLYCMHRFGISYDEYFDFECYKLNAEGKSAFVSEKIRYKYYSQLNDEKNYSNTFLNKMETYRAFKKFYKREIGLIEEKTEFGDFKEFVERNNDFVIKPLAGQCGIGFKKYRLSEISDLHQLFNEIHSSGSYVMEAQIHQSDVMGRFHPESVNTIRVPSIYMGDKTVIFHPWFRMGQGKSMVDNGGSGGIFADIDEETGIVYTVGYDEQGKRYLFHPDSGEKIVGFQIPEWDKVKALVRNLSKVISQMRYVGWDLAYTDNGWVLVEGNGSGQMLFQYADKTGRKQELKDLMQQLKISD